MRLFYEGRVSALGVALVLASAPYRSSANAHFAAPATIYQSGEVSNEGEAKNQEEEEAPCLRPDAPKPKFVVSFGVLNSKAVSIPKPEYPAAAKTARISGNVQVDATIGEEGEVMRARVRTGHPVLQVAVKKVVCQARFKPIRLSGRSVAVNGIIVYRFILE